MEEAATKIQSGFRGMKARREVQELKESRLGDSKENVTEEQTEQKDSEGKEDEEETPEETQEKSEDTQPDQG